jgi:GxxExxY protein
MAGKDPRTRAIIGAAMEVHRHLGPGMLEKAYHEAMLVEMKQSQIPVASEVDLPIFYKGVKLSTVYRPDLVCYEGIIVELKAVQALTRVETAQLLHYLKATGQELGLLLNFGASSLEFKRVVNDQSAKSA